MIQISDELRAKIQRGRARTHAKLVMDDHVFGYDNKNETAPPKDDGSICKLEFEYNLSENDFAIGTACSHMCEVILYGAQNLEFEGKYVKAYIGYELDETFVINGRAYPKIEWVPMGTFFIHDIIKKGPLVSFTGFDRMDNLGGMIYVPSSSLGSHPKAYNVFMDIFSFASIPYNAESFTKIMNFTVDMSLLYGTEKDGNTTGHTVREALMYLAGRAGGCVIINRYDEMQFVEYSFANIYETVDEFSIETEYLITDNDVADFEVMGDGVHGMKYIECAYSQDVVRYEDSTTKYKNGFVLDSPLNTTVYDAKSILDHINNIYRHHGGIFYMTPCYFKLMNGDVSIELGDIISYAKNKNFAANMQSYIPIMHIKIKYTGKPDIEIESYSKTDAEHLNRVGPIYRSFTAFKRVSDNNYKYLDEAFKTVSNQIMGADGGYIVVDKNEDGTWRQMRVLDNVDKPNSMIVLNKNGIGFSNDGSGNITSAAITIDGKIVANSMTGGVLQAAQGEIGGWNIGPNNLICSAVHDGKTYQASLNKYLNNFATNAVFAVTVTDNNTGERSWPIIMRYNGQFIANNAQIRGDITADSGKIAGWTIEDGYLQSIASSRRVRIKATAGSDGNIFEIFNTASNSTIFYINGSGKLYVGGNSKFERDASFEYVYFNQGMNLSFLSAGSLYVNSNGSVYSSSSSKRYKENVTDELPAELNPKALYDLPVVAFNYKDEFADKSLIDGTQIGLIAEDVAEIFPNAAIYNKEGEVENWQERIMIPAMLKLIQEQKSELDSLKEEIAQLKTIVEKLRK